MTGSGAKSSSAGDSLLVSSLSHASAPASSVVWSLLAGVVSDAMKNPLGFAGAIAMLEPNCCAAVVGLATVCGVVRFYKTKRTEEEQQKLLAEIQRLAAKASDGTDILHDLRDGTLMLSVEVDDLVKQDIANFVDATSAKPGSAMRAAIREEFEEALREGATPGQLLWIGKTYPEFAETIEILLWTIDHRTREHTALLREIVAWIRAGGFKGGQPFRPLSNLPALSPTYTRRPDITKRIHDALHSSTEVSAIRQAAARAYGGYGKTVAAVLYGHEYAAAYPGGRFFLSMEKADLVTALASLGHHFGVPDDAKPEHAAVAVADALAHAQHDDGTPAASLLILDNIVDADQWKRLLAVRRPGTDDGLMPRGNCRLLITTRAENIPQAEMVRVEKLSEAEARDIYRRFCERAGGADGIGRSLPGGGTADRITKLVGGLAVAVAAVAALMMLNPELEWDDYATHLATLKTDDLPSASEEVRAEIGLDGRALEEYRRTLRVIDDALKALPEAEMRAVEYAAVLPEDMVPAPWLIALLRVDAARPAEGADGTPDPMRISCPTDPRVPVDPAMAAIAHLRRLDLLTETGEDARILSLHRLWRARVVERADEAGRDLSPLVAATAAYAIGRYAEIVGVDKKGQDRGVNDPAAVTEPALRWELTPLAAVCVTLWEQGAPGPAARLGVWLAVVLRQLGQYAEAGACLRPVGNHEAAVEAAVGETGLAQCLSNLATILADLGDLAGARSNMERAIAIDEKAYDADHPTLALRYSNLATILADLGDLAGARARMERAIAIEEKAYDADHPTLAVSYSNLAAILQDLGDLAGARTHMERAIAIDEKAYDADHPTLALRYSNLALILQDLGDLAGARARMERAIAIDEKAYDADHPTLALRYSNLATILQDLGDLAGARARMERAIAIDEKAYDADHPLLAIRYNNLAGICFAEGKRAEACGLWNQALAILLKHFDEDHPHVKITRASMKIAGCDGAGSPG